MRAMLTSAFHLVDDAIVSGLDHLADAAPRVHDGLAMLIVGVAHPLRLISDAEVKEVSEMLAENAAERVRAAEQRAAEFDPIG